MYESRITCCEVHGLTGRTGWGEDYISCVTKHDTPPGPRGHLGSVDQFNTHPNAISRGLDVQIFWSI